MLFTHFPEIFLLKPSIITAKNVTVSVTVNVTVKYFKDAISSTTIFKKLVVEILSPKKIRLRDF